MDVEKLKSQLGKRIKYYREKKGYTQEKFCEIIDLDQSNLSKIENGKSFPDIITIYAIIKQADIEPNFLFGYTDNDNIKYTPIDYKILDLLLKLPEEAKIHIKNIINLIK